MYLLDTNICIYFMKNRFPAMTQKILSLDPSDLCLSSITVYELEYGAEKSRWGENTRQKLAMFLAPFRILPFEVDDAIVAASIRAVLERKGSPIGPYDTLIAAQAIARQLTLVTYNTGEFSRIPHIQLEDWVG